MNTLMIFKYKDVSLPNHAFLIASMLCEWVYGSVVPFCVPLLFCFYHFKILHTLTFTLHTLAD